jgi:hypothetical protein
MTKYADYTAFSKTRRVPLELYHMTEYEEPEELLWVERGEDYYALLSPQLKTKRVGVVTRRAWMEAG